MTRQTLFFLTTITLILVLGGNYFATYFENADASSSDQSHQVKSFDASTLPKPKIGLPNRPSSRLLVHARSYILIDGQTKYPLAERDPDRPVPIASVTKLMTYLVAHEAYKNDEVVTISPSAARVTGSELQLLTGEKITVHDLLSALLINSANDAAHALAEHSGSLDEFVDKMNDKAASLGLYNTEFQDPAGLEDTGHSTPRDIALLLNYLLDDPQFTEIIHTSKKTINSVDNRYQHELTNSNRLINPEESLYYPPAIGGKTGFTFEAGHCLATAAESASGQRQIAVVLHTSEESKEASAREVRKLLVWGAE